MDFGEAFVCVDHQILLKNLSRYGIKGIVLELFQCHFTDRKQFVPLNGLASWACSNKACVLQGTIRSPLLFPIMINDFPKCSKFIKLTLYSEYITFKTCLFSNMSMENITNSINKNLETGNHWLNVNKIKVKTHKSDHTVFSSRKKILV